MGTLITCGAKRTSSLGLFRTRKVDRVERGRSWVFPLNQGVGTHSPICRAYRLPNHQVGEPAHEHLGWQVASMLTTERTLGSDRLGWHRLYGRRSAPSDRLLEASGSGSGQRRRPWNAPGLRAKTHLRSAVAQLDRAEDD